MQGGHHGRARGDADQQSLFPGQPPGQVDRVVVADADDLVDQIQVKHRRDEPGADALDRVGSLLTAGQHRRRGRFHGHELHRGLAFLDDLGHTGDSAAGADSGHEDVDLPVGVAPDLLRGGFAVNGRVGRVFELLGHEIPLIGLGQFLGLGDCAGHAVGARGQDEFGTVGEQ